MKKFISGFLVGAILCGGVVFGVSYVAEPAGFDVLVNGSIFTSDPPPLVVEGRTYLPLRAMGDALGVPVNWNAELNRAEVGNTAPVAQAGEFSRQNPAPVNTVQTVNVDNYISKYSVAVRVTETIRGADAANMVKEANMFNRVADEGKEYIVAKIAVSVLSVEDDKSVSVSPIDFDCFSGNNEKYSYGSVVAPEPTLRTELYAGGNAEGYAVFEVNQNDTNPKVVYGAKYDGTGGIWFALQ